MDLALTWTRMSRYIPCGMVRMRDDISLSRSSSARFRLHVNMVVTSKCLIAFCTHSVGLFQYQIHAFHIKLLSVDCEYNAQVIWTMRKVHFVKKYIYFI